MATTSKSPKRVLLAAHHVVQRTLRKYWHRFSPKKFTLPQWFACLVLKEFLRLDYRKLSALLEDTPSLGAAIGCSSYRPDDDMTKQAKSKRIRIIKANKPGDFS